MCIMEVREDQPTSIVAQACAHNVSTIERDLDMFERMLEARGVRAAITEHVYRAHESLRTAYSALLNAYSVAVADNVFR